MIDPQRCSELRTNQEREGWRKLLRENMIAAKKLHGQALGSLATGKLKNLTRTFRLSVTGGDLQILNGAWYVTHTGLIRLARRKKCCGIHVEVVDSLCDSAANRFVLKATVYTSKNSSGFVGYGDADPSNVSPLVRGAEMRVAETRAVNRALRKAYGIGICSVEEIGSLPTLSEKLPAQSTHGNGNNGSNADPAFKVSNIQVAASGNQLTATVAIAASASSGPRMVLVSSANGESSDKTSTANTFTVQ